MDSIIHVVSIIIIFIIVMPIAEYLDSKWRDFLDSISKNTNSEVQTKASNNDKYNEEDTNSNETQIFFTKDTTSESQEEILLNNLGINYIFHMTHINNLSSILQNGLLSHNNNFVNIDISNKEVNDRRNSIEPIYYRNIHSYVPFYFNPKNAMLYSKKGIQDYIIILAVDRTLIYQHNSLFTDGNAASNVTKFYNDLTKINNLNWDCINAKTWFDIEDGKRMRMAEILVFNSIETKYIQKIYCNNYKAKQYIINLVTINKLNIKVEINSNLFF